MSTMQELFDMSVRGIIAQGGPSISTNAGSLAVECFYRSPTSQRKCAVGQWIPDDKHTDDLEGMGLQYVLRKCKIDVPQDFAQKLQNAHDVAATKSTPRGDIVPSELSQFWQDWYFGLKKIVYDWKLDGSVLKEIPISGGVS